MESSKRKVYDCFTWWCELDLLKLRLSILDPFVDYFVIVESRQTFSGNPKPLYLQENIEQFAMWKDKLIIITAPNIELKDPNNLFERHYLAYELLEEKVMEIGESEDICFMSDADEVWNPDILNQIDDYPHSLYQIAYAYWLNNRCSEQWTGTLMTKVKNVFEGFNKLNRTAKPFPLENGGYHFTNLGGAKMIIEKIKAYDHSNEVVPTLSQFKDFGIQERMDNNNDYLGRLLDYDGKPFRFWVDESQWPTYLKEHKQDWIHLCK